MWNLTQDLSQAADVYPTLLRYEVLTGSQDEAGSVHTCFHGDQIGTMVHQVLLFDPDKRRFTHLISNVWGVDRMYQSSEFVDNGAGGTLASLRYSFEPGATLDSASRQLAVDVIREHTERDCAGLKRRAEELAAPLTGE